MARSPLNDIFRTPVERPMMASTAKTQLKLKQTILHLPEEAKKQLDYLAVDTGKTRQALMAEALNLLFVHHDLPPIA